MIWTRRNRLRRLGLEISSPLGSPQRPVILDVRSAQEWSQDHLEGAIHIPLPHLLRRVGGFSRNLPLTVVFGSGYRSSIAASLLESEGFERLSNVMGGMHAVRHAKRPRLNPEPLGGLVEETKSIKHTRTCGSLLAPPLGDCRGFLVESSNRWGRRLMSQHQIW
jgi:rhodanese-related sulfurtransferase